MDTLSRIPAVVAKTEAGSDRQHRALSALPVAVDTARKASQRVSRVVDSLQNFAGLDNAEWQAFDVHPGIDGALDLLHGQLAKGISVEKDYGTLPKLNGYPAQLNQALLHLLSNAVEAMRDGGHLRIVTRAGERFVTVEITDTGKGIEPRLLENVFMPALSRDGGRVHMGLALPTSRRIVEDHGGTLELRSTLGEGTTATISHPRP